MTQQELKAAGTDALAAARARLLHTSPFLAHLTFALPIIMVIDDRVPTAATDGASIFLNPRFWLELSAEERAFVLGHEVWHCALGHLPRRHGREMMAWNLAIDYETNHLLLAEGLEAPCGSLVEARFAGLNAEAIYPLLGPDASGAGFDGHISEVAPPGNCADGEFQPCPGAMTIARSQYLLTAAARAIGTASSTLPNHVQALLAAKITPTDWRAVLAAFIARSASSPPSWTRMQRRFLAQGLRLPARQRCLGRVCVAVDVSGSVLDRYGRFLDEVRAVCRGAQAEVVDVLFFDVTIRARQGAGGPLGRGLRRGGGTDFRPLFSDPVLIGQPPDALVILTDGLGPAPAAPPPFPVLWALTQGGAPPVSWGAHLPLPMAQE